MWLRHCRFAYPPSPRLSLPRQAACSVKFEFSTVPVCWSPCHHTAIQYCTPTVEDTPPRHVPRCSNRCFFRQHWQKDAVRSCTAVGRTMTARREPHNATTATNDCCGSSNSTPWSNVEEGLGIGSRSLPRWHNTQPVKSAAANLKSMIHSIVAIQHNPSRAETIAFNSIGVVPLCVHFFGSLVATVSQTCCCKAFENAMATTLFDNLRHIEATHRFFCESDVILCPLELVLHTGLVIEYENTDHALSQVARHHPLPSQQQDCN